MLYVNAVYCILLCPRAARAGRHFAFHVAVNVCESQSIYIQLRGCLVCMSRSGSELPASGYLVNSLSCSIQRHPQSNTAIICCVH